jgi:hypothetical protein
MAYQEFQRVLLSLTNLFPELSLRNAETYSQDQEDDIGEEGDGEIEPPVLISEAISALETLQRFEIAREDGSQNIRVLNSLARELSALQVSKKSQRTLDSFCCM